MALGEIEAEMHWFAFREFRLAGQLRFEYLFAHLDVHDGNSAERLDFIDCRRHRSDPSEFVCDAKVFGSNAEPSSAVTRIRLGRDRCKRHLESLEQAA